MSRFHEVDMDSIRGEPVHFFEFDGRISLDVHVASQ